MYDKSFGLSFFMKRPQNYDGGEMYIYLRITVDGQYKDLSTRRRWPAEKWSARAGKAIGNKEDSRSLNQLLMAMEEKALDARRKLLDNNTRVTAKAIKDLMQGIDGRRMILEIFLKHNQRVESLVPMQYSPGTLDLFERTLEHTRSYILTNYSEDDMDIKNLDYEFISGFHHWLRSVRKCQQNTTVKYLTYFKKIVLICVKSKWLPGDPFVDFKMTKKEVLRPFLSKDELDRVRKKEFSIERLSQVRDIFVFSCYTGLAYADVHKLKSSEIVNGVDGKKWLNIKRQKTDTLSAVPLLDVPLLLLKKYQNHPSCIANGVLFPVLSNQKMNAYLKEIADVCSIDKILSFHIARHTFATTITLSNGIPIETVSKMLGHKSLRQTQHYAKVLHTKIADEMSTLNTKLRRQEKVNASKTTPRY